MEEKKTPTRGEELRKALSYDKKNGYDRLLSGERSPELFRQLETYTVQLSDGELHKLDGAVAVGLDGTVMMLQSNYYDAKGPGVVFDPLPLDPMFQ